MLTADQLDRLADPLMALYREYEQSVLNDIARRLATGRAKELEWAAWQVQRLSESGLLEQTIYERLAGLTHQGETELKRLFRDAGVKAMAFDDSIYRAAGLNPLPLNMSPVMAQVLAAGLQKTSGVVRNLAQTTALAGQEAYINAVNLAYVQISTGAMSYTDAIRDAIKRAADDGLRVVNFASGRRDQIDVAVRRATLTGINQTTGQLQWTRADEMGCDLVQTTAHAGARPSHQEWQGRVFSRSGTNRKYPPFIESTGYGTVTGLQGANCRHSWFCWFEDLSPDVYHDAGIDPRQDKTVTVDDQELSLYDATQRQRAMERQIRKWTRQARALEAAELDATAVRAHLKQWNARLKDFTAKTGLKRQRVREQIYDGANVQTRP